MEDIMDEDYWLLHPEQLEDAAAKAKQEFLGVRKRYMELGSRFNRLAAKRRRLAEMDTRVKRALACKRAREAGIAAPCFEGVPAEIRHKIFSYLEMPDVARCKRVCKDWADVIDTDAEAEARFGKVPDQLLPINKYRFARDVYEKGVDESHWDVCAFGGLYRDVGVYLGVHHLTKHGNTVYIHAGVAYIIAKTRRFAAWPDHVEEHLKHGIVAIPDKPFTIIAHYVVLRDEHVFWIIDFTKPRRPLGIPIIGWNILEGPWASPDRRHVLCQVRHHVDPRQPTQVLELDPATGTYEVRPFTFGG